MVHDGDQATGELHHPLVKDGWFTEANALWPGQRFSLKVLAIVHTQKSAFQDILIFDSESYGRVLVLDGAIQCSTRDEVRVAGGGEVSGLLWCFPDTGCSASGRLCQLRFPYCQISGG